MSSSYEIPQGKITIEGLEQLNRRIGKKMRMDGNELVCRETVRKWVDGIGDINPLYRDLSAAEKSIWNSLMAPPSFLYSVHPTWAFQGLPGVVGFHSGNDWNFMVPLYAGDRIQADCTFLGYDERPGSFAGRMIFEKYQTNYTNQHQELVASVRAQVARVERGAAQTKGKEHVLQVPHPWKKDELQELFYEALKEKPVGAATRWWDDVVVGDTIPKLIKGPIGVGDVVAFIGGGFSAVASTGVALQDYAKRPKWAFRDPETQALEPMAAVHWSPYAAKTGGAAYAYDIGIQRNSWLIQLLTNWAGDEGWVKECAAEYRGFVYLGDALQLEATVSRKFVDDDGEACLELQTAARNQRNVDTMPGSAVVALPKRDGSLSPAARRLRHRK